MTEGLGRQVVAELLARGELALWVYERGGATVRVLRHGDVLLIGREAPADLVLAGGGLSRQHARLTCSMAAVSIEDLDSKNGTFVNGVRVASAQLRLGDRITIGDVLLALQPSGSGSEQPRLIEGHEHFMRRLHEEVVRSRALRHACAVVMVEAREHSRHVASWRGVLETTLRSIDHVGLYSSSALEVLVPETGALGAKELASRIAAADPGLRCGFASYPDDGNTSAALIGECRARCCGRVARDGDDTAEAGIVVGPQLGRVFAEVERVAKSDLPVLIVGETGVGKELVAQHVHATSRRHGSRLCAINCAAIPETLLESVLFGHEKGAFTGAETRRIGLLESAQGGTVFFDEIGELPLPAQAALLRALDSKRIRRVGANEEIELDIRVVAATHRDLDQRRAEGNFRDDLLYRLAGATVRVPPLRERKSEIEPLARRFVSGIAKAMQSETPSLAPEVLALLLAHDWPGNVRELRNAMERAVAVCRDASIEPEDLPDAVRRQARGCPGNQQPSVSFADAVRQFECELIIDALRASDWNQTQAAERLRLPRRTLVHKIRAYGIRKLGFGVE